MRNIRTAVLAGLVFTLGLACVIHAQEAPHSPAPQQATMQTAARLKVRIVISKFDETEAGRKAGRGGLISSLPYEIRLNADNRNASLRLSEKVPILSGNKDNTFTYMDVGTNIDCTVAAPTAADRFTVQLTIQDTSVISQTASGSQPAMPANPPIIHSLSTSNTLSLKNGEAIQFVAATDKASHETTKVEVTLTVEN